MASLPSVVLGFLAALVVAPFVESVLPSVLLAWLLGFLVQAAFACLAFWLEQSQGLFGVWFSVWMLLSGYLAPLDLFPEPIRDVLAWLPFRGMMAVPVELLAGTLSAEEAWFDLAVMSGWTVVLVLGVWAVWTAGIKRYGAFGA